MSEEDDPRKVPTRRDTGTLQRGPGFRDEALALAHRLAKLVERFTSVKHTNIRAATTCRRMRDEACLLALEFDSWVAIPTTSETRVATVDRFLALKERAEMFADQA